MSITMGRKKAKIEELLIHRINSRISDKALKRLEGLLAKSNCSSIAELVRRIVSKEKIIVLHRDMRLQEHVHELAGIRAELRSIGTNVNQIMRHFHAADSERKKMFYAMEVADEYAKVGEKVSTLMEMVDALGRKWLQR
jgi:hypothetical protein